MCLYAKFHCSRFALYRVMLISTFYVPSDRMVGLYLKFGFGQGYTIKYIYIITHDCLFGPSLCG